MLPRSPWSMAHAVLALAIVQVTAATAGAQTPFGSRGATSLRPTGVSQSPGGSAFGSNSGFGSSSFGSSSGFGTTGSGFGSGSGFGTSSTVGGIGMSGSGAFGSGQPLGLSGAFLGANQSQTFIGSRQVTGTGGFNSLGGFGGMSGLSGLSRGGFGSTAFGGRGRNQQGQFGQQGINRSVTPNSSVQAFRPQQRIAFDYAAPTQVEVNQSIRVNLDDVASRRPELRGITVTLDENGMATLTGTVPTPAARGLAEAMVRIEPGVRRINNELTISGAVR